MVFGNSEPDRFPDNDPGNVLALAIEGAGAPPSVTVVRSAQFTWIKREVMLADASDITALDARLSGLSPALASVLLRLRVSGSLTLADAAALRHWQESFEGRVRHLELDDASLSVRASAQDLAIAGEDGALRDAALALAEISNDVAHSDSAAATRALQMLYAFAAKVRQEAS